MEQNNYKKYSYFSGLYKKENNVYNNISRSPYETGIETYIALFNECLEKRSHWKHIDKDDVFDCKKIDFVFCQCKQYIYEGNYLI